MDENIDEVFRDFEVDGVPSSGVHKPIKSKIRKWGRELVEKFNALQASIPHLITAALALAIVSRPLVVFVTGQSNTTIARTGTWVAPKNVFLWDWDNQDPTTPGTGFIPWSDSLITSFGYVAQELSAKYPGRKIYMIVIGLGGQPIENWLPTGDANAVDMFEAITDNVPLALAEIGQSEIDVFLWWQGEADASINQIAVYPTRYDLLEARLKSQSWFPDDTPQIIFQLAPEVPLIPGGVHASTQRHDAMNRALVKVAANDSTRRKLVRTADLKFDTDSIHVDKDSMPLVGKLAVNALFHDVSMAVKPGKRLNDNGAFEYVEVNLPQSSIGTGGLREGPKGIKAFNSGPSGSVSIDTAFHNAGQGQDSARSYIVISKESGTTGAFGLVAKVASIDVARLSGTRFAISVKLRRSSAGLTNPAVVRALLVTANTTQTPGGAGGLARIEVNKDAIKTDVFRYITMSVNIPSGTTGQDLQIEVFFTEPGTASMQLHVSELQAESGRLSTPFEYRSIKLEELLTA